MSDSKTHINDFRQLTGRLSHVTLPGSCPAFVDAVVEAQVAASEKEPLDWVNMLRTLMLCYRQVEMLSYLGIA